LDRVISTNSFTLGVTHEGAANPLARRKVSGYYSLNNKPTIVIAATGRIVLRIS
jgi:hypothetical protein